MSHLFFSGVHSEEVNALLRAHCWVILRMTSVNIANLDSRFKSCLLYQLIADLCDVFCVLETRQGQSDKMNLLGVCPPGFLFFNNSSYSVLVVGKYFFLPCWSHSTLPLNISFACSSPFYLTLLIAYQQLSRTQEAARRFFTFLTTVWGWIPTFSGQWW